MDSSLSKLNEPSAAQKERALAFGHGLFYLITGPWPLVSMQSFEAISGPKTDKWLVKTIGLLLTVIGAALLGASRRKRLSREIQILAIGSAASLGRDRFYLRRQRTNFSGLPS